MDKTGKIVKWLSSFMVLVILSASIYVMLPDKVKLLVGKTNTELYVWEADSWTLGATEYVNLFDGTTKMRAKARYLNTSTQGDITIITRLSLWKDNISTWDTYTFRSDLNSVESVPVSHIMECINCQGKIVHFEYRDIDYNGVTRTAISPERFGHDTVVEWVDDDDFSWAKVYQQKSVDKLVIRFKADEAYEAYSVRLFDPPTLELNNFTKNIDAELGSIINVEVNSTTDIICVDIDHHNYGVNYSCGSNLSIFVFDDNFNDTAITYLNSHTPKPIGTSWSMAYQSNGGKMYVDTSGYLKCSINVLFDPDGAVYIADDSPLSNEYNVSITLANIQKGDKYPFFLVGRWIDENNSYIVRLSNDSYGNNIYLVENGVSTILSTASYPVSNTDKVTFSITDTNKSVWINDTLWMSTANNNITNIGNGGVGCGDLLNDSNECLLFWYVHNFTITHESFSETSFDLNITNFRRTFLNDSATETNVSFQGPMNQTIYLQAHQYDRVDSLTLNLTGHSYNGTFPEDVNIYINGTLSNEVGKVLNASYFTLTTFNNSKSSKNTSFTGNQVKIAGYLKIPKLSNVTSAVFNLSSDDSIEDSLGFPDSPYMIIKATSVNTTAFNINNVAAWNYTDPFSGVTTWMINSSSANVEVQRAEIYETLFYGANARANTTYLQGVSALAIDVNRDVGKRGQYVRLVVNKNGGVQAISSYKINYNNNVTNYNCSSWSNLSTAWASSASWSNPTGTTLNSIGASTNSDELGTDRTADEATNPNTGALVVDDSLYDGLESYADVILLCAGTVFWNGTNTGDGVFTFTSRDYTNTNGMPLLSNWTNYYAYDVWMEIGILDGVREFEMSGLLNHTNKTTDFASSINTHLSTCTADSDGFCNVPINVRSLTSSFVEISAIEINYTDNINPVSLDTSLVEGFLNRSTNFTNIPITFESSKNGTLQINDLKYDYAGGNQTYTVLAHNTSYTDNTSYNITYHFSDWSYELPLYVDYIEFIPQTPTTSNVVPYGQRSLVPILNITPRNYGSKTLNYSLYMNESMSCVNLTVSVDKYQANGTVMVENNWTQVIGERVQDEYFGLWMFADYGCNYTDWHLFNPYMGFRACCDGCDVCSEAYI